MKAEDFRRKMRVRVKEKLDLMASCHGAMGLSPVELEKGEQATVVGVDPDMVLLIFDRYIHFPAEFGGPARDVFAHDPNLASGLTWDDIEPVEG